MFLLMTAGMILFTACSEDDDPAAPVDQNPSAVIAVFSDPHYFDPTLGSSGSAFESYIAMDRKLIAESHALTEAAVSAILSTDANIVIVPGDLTKDGERSSHERFAAFCAQLEQAGKAVFVVPGNHDVRNPHAVRYEGNQALPVASVTEQEFAQIYAEYGYDEAIARDPASLSYVAEPVDGIWVLGMDACRYSENEGEGHAVTGGRLSAATEGWIKARLQEAQAQEKTVFGVMHHGLLEHFQGQKLNPISADYVVDDWARLSGEFADLGMHIVLTGHFHSNDVVEKRTSESFLFDIETGSLLTWPCPYRIMRLNSDRTLDITTAVIENIQYDTGGDAFQDYAYGYLESGMLGLSTYILTSQFGVDEQTAQMLAPVMTEAFVTHYRGDETMTAEAQGVITTLKQAGDANSLFMASALEALFSDPPPADNTLTINLESGMVK